MSCIRSRRAKYLAGFALLAVIPAIAVAQEDAKKDETFGLQTTVAISNLKSFDISWVDVSLGEYFLADRSNKSVDVLTTGSSPALLTQIVPPGAYAFAGVAATCPSPNACNGPNGVLTLANTGGNEIWVGDAPTAQSATTTGATCATDVVFSSPAIPLAGKCSTLKVFAVGGSATPTHVIPTNGQLRADELCFDPKDHLVLIANDADSPPFVSFISTDTYTVVKQLPFSEATNGIEQCQWSPRTGMIYQNIPEVNGPGNDTVDGNTYVINPKTMTVVKKFDIPIADCAGPQGMTIGPSRQILLGCNAPSIPSGVRNSVVINENSGGVIATLSGFGGADEVWFNSGDGHYFITGSTPGSTAPLTPQHLWIADSRGDRPDASVLVTSSSSVGSHSVAADPTTNFAYVPVSGGINIYGPSGRDDHSAFVRRHDDD